MIKSYCKKSISSRLLHSDPYTLKVNFIIEFVGGIGSLKPSRR